MLNYQSTQVIMMIT